MGRDIDSVFEAGSQANHEALVDLREMLEHLGFRVVKKIEKEDTLRAYVKRLYSYPLLNPRFVRRSVRGLSGRAFLEISAWSKGDDSLGQYLRSFRSALEITFVSPTDAPHTLTEADANALVLHGSFYIRLRFREDARTTPDLNALGVVLKDLRDFLSEAA